MQLTKLETTQKVEKFDAKYRPVVYITVCPLQCGISQTKMT